MPTQIERRLGAIAAISGGLLLLAGTVLHPLGADPNDPVAAFTGVAVRREPRLRHGPGPVRRAGA